MYCAYETEKSNFNIKSNNFEIAFNGWNFATFNYHTQFTATTTMILLMTEHVYRIKYV